MLSGLQHKRTARWVSAEPKGNSCSAYWQPPSVAASYVESICNVKRILSLPAVPGKSPVAESCAAHQFRVVHPPQRTPLSRGLRSPPRRGSSRISHHGDTETQRCMDQRYAAMRRTLRNPRGFPRSLLQPLEEYDAFFVPSVPLWKGPRRRAPGPPRRAHCRSARRPSPHKAGRSTILFHFDH